ncbi:hypothetical protein NBRC111452_2515 [Companilactobacillus farciminis]|nr:hypothetical protein NBRC111452_2515 [Companilactobacillus farciminis]
MNRGDYYDPLYFWANLRNEFFSPIGVVIGSYNLSTEYLE